MEFAKITIMDLIVIGTWVIVVIPLMNWNWNVVVLGVNVMSAF